MKTPNPRVQVLFDKATGQFLTISGGVVSNSSNPLTFSPTDTIANIATTYAVSFSASVILIFALIIPEQINIY